MERSTEAGEWVMLLYRLPREPSTPRISVWRKLRQLGVAQLADGLVALPADARTREQLEWVCAQVQEAAGDASLWMARPLSRAEERSVAAQLAEQRAAEYAAVGRRAAEAGDLSGQARQRALRRLRQELRRIRRRDFFPPPEREAAVAAVEALAEPMPSPSPLNAAAGEGRRG
jgi:hypothetical protein